MISYASEKRRHRGYTVTAAAVLAAAVALATARAQAAPADTVQSVASIRAAAESFVRMQLQSTPGVTSVSAGGVDARLRLARCAGPLHAELPSAMASQSHFMVGVSCSAPVRWSLYVPVLVERRISVLVLRHAVSRDARLTAQDVVVETRKLTGRSEAYLGDPSELRDRTVLRTLPAGTPLTIDMFTADFVVHRGQDVMLLAGSATIEVRAAGRALEDAPAGARLKVQNLSSMRVVEGVVESADVVRVAP